MILINFERNVHLIGKLQSWRYFDHFKRRIKEQFKFDPGIQGQANEFIQGAGRSHCNDNDSCTFVGIQVKRGNYLDTRQKELGYTVATDSYFKNAMDHFVKRYGSVVFIVESDDVQWSRTHVAHGGLGVVHATSGLAYLDLAILSACNHSIISVGSFGWWGAYLAGGDTVYYRKFPKQGSKLDKSFKLDDYYPPDWVGMV